MNKTPDILTQNRKIAIDDAIKQVARNLHEFCIKYDEDYAQWYRILNNNLRITDKVIRRLENKLCKPIGYFDANRQEHKSIKIPLISNYVNIGSAVEDIITTFELIEYPMVTIETWKLNEQRLMMFIMNDESMIPIIKPKMNLLVDGTQTIINNGKYYLIKLGKAIEVRKLFNIPLNDEIKIIPENKVDFEEHIVKSDQIDILGKVIFLEGLM